MVSLLTLFIAGMTDFSGAGVGGAQQEERCEWNAGVLSGGLGLFLGMLALYTFLTWAPMFVKDKFGVPFEEAGNIITQYWTAALLG
ncbi:MFS transporter TsgA, partial [Aeromonas diversa]